MPKQTSHNRPALLILQYRTMPLENQKQSERWKTPKSLNKFKCNHITCGITFGKDVCVVITYFTHLFFYLGSNWSMWWLHRHLFQIPHRYLQNRIVSNYPSTKEIIKLYYSNIMLGTEGAYSEKAGIILPLP